MQNPLVSIIICNYNYGQFVSKAIDSALEQDYSNFEIIVVDDGSTDNSREVINSYGSSIRPIFKENGGQASAFNHGFEASSGDIICLLDSDDVFSRSKLKRIVATFQDHPEIGWCFNSQVEVDLSTGDLVQRIAAPETGQPIDLIDSIRCRGEKPIFAPATSCTSFRRTLLSQILPMPEGQSIELNDNFIKFIAVSLAKGYFLNDDLTYMGIHGQNLYTRSQTRDLIHAKVDILTAYWLNKRFPRIQKFANRLFRTGLGNYWRCDTKDHRFTPLIKEYLNSIDGLEKIIILIIAYAHYCNLVSAFRKLKSFVRYFSFYQT